MSNQPSSTRLVILFALDPANDRPAERLVLMHRFLGSGLGAGIQVLDQAFFPNYARVGFFLVVEAASKEVVVSALQPVAGIFTTTVEEPVSLTLATDAPTATYAVFGISTPHVSAPLALVGAPTSSAAPRIRLHAQLPEGGEVSSITLVDAPTFGAADSFGRSSVATAVTEAAQMQPMADYITAMRATTTAPESRPTPPVDSAAAVLASATDAASGTYTLTALDSPLITLSSNYLMPFSESMPLAVAPVGTATSLSGRTYVWQRLHGYFSLVVDWSNANNLWIHSPAQLSGDFNWTRPIAVLPDAPGLNYTLGTSSSHPLTITNDLRTWLNGLMATDTYDAAWPEDSYTGGQLAAYQFIVSRMPGQTPPNRGTIKESQEIEVISYPGGTAFTSAEFDDVKNHLLVEIGHFVTADQWFGPNGIINAINTQVSVLSAGDLTEAAAMMSIPPTNSVTMSLDEIFGLVAAWVAEIPEIGGVIAAVIDTGYAVAKAVIPQEAHQPIQATVAAIADQLNEYLIYLVRSAALQHARVSSDWGRLSQFSDGVATGRISVGAFYGAGGPDSGTGAVARSADSGPPPLPPDYLHAAKNAWLTYVYQELFTTQHSVNCQMSLTDQPPANPWDPQSGNYHWTWSLPCAYTDSKNNLHDHGYLIHDCSTDAPAEVMAQLFAPGSALAVNPMEFFCGFNGWPSVDPHYAGGYQNISNNIPFPGFVRIGLDSWGGMPG